jgi:hypothetical protein
VLAEVNQKTRSVQRLMPRWRVDYIGKYGKQHVGTVEAPDEKSAFAEAAKQFNITPARRSKLVVTRIDTPKQ